MMPQPPLEVLAEVAYESFLQTLGDFKPPFAKPWAGVPPTVRKAWQGAVAAVLEKIGTA